MELEQRNCRDGRSCHRRGHAVAPGTANVIATSEGVTGQATLIVMPVPVASVTVSLAASSIIAGTSTTASAETRDAANNVLHGPCSCLELDRSHGGDRRCGDRCGDGVAPGTRTSSRRAKGDHRAGGAYRLWSRLHRSAWRWTPRRRRWHRDIATAVSRDAGGAELTGRPVTWSSSNETVATVDGNTGAVTALTAGQRQYHRDEPGERDHRASDAHRPRTSRVGQRDSGPLDSHRGHADNRDRGQS